jgi:hypothetical protein
LPGDRTGNVGFPQVRVAGASRPTRGKAEAGGKPISACYVRAMEERASSKPTVRKRAEEIKQFRCRNLIAVIENPTDVKNIGTVIRNANALGVEKV